MIVECSHCHTKYNIDEKKIPLAGVRVKCRECQTILFIKREVPTSQRAAPLGETSPAPETQEQTVQERPQGPAPTVEPPPVSRPPGAEVEVPPRSRPPREEEMGEEDKKWHNRARRLAKALASDLVLYNKDKVEEGLRENTLARLLGAEIRRSWEYYCQQIPQHIRDSSDYFKEQLNKIVGKGKEIFK